MAFSKLSVERLKNQVDIVDVIGSVVDLKKQGANYKACCPFHGEKTPSFVVSQDKQIFTCFGCHASGDVIEFTKKYYNLDFNEAVKKLSEQYNIPLEETGFQNNYSEYYKANQVAAEFFYRAFTKGPNRGYTYMKQRGISPRILKRFGIGYADEEWSSLSDHFKSRGIDEKIIIELGLCSKGKNGKLYDRFRNRVMFPIVNTAGKIIGFGGRAIDESDNPKYLNSPESKIFKKKDNLYGLNLSRNNIKQGNPLIVVEGYMDVIGLNQSGVETAAASLGTALTSNQANLIKRYTKEVVLSYDADKAGRAAALRGIDVLKNADCRVKVLHVTGAKDPDEYIKKHGKEDFLKLVDKALPSAEYKILNAATGYDLKNEDDKIRYIKKLTKEVFTTFDSVEREIYSKKVSGELGISLEALSMAVEEDVKHEDENNKLRHDTRVVGGTIKSDETHEEPTLIERDAIKLIIRDESYIDKIDEINDFFDTTIAELIFDAIKNDVSSEGVLDINRVLDILDEVSSWYLKDILENTPSAKSTDDIFADCVKRNEMKKLNIEQKNILKELSLINESDEAASEQAALLMTKLKYIQEKMSRKE